MRFLFIELTSTIYITEMLRFKQNKIKEHRKKKKKNEVSLISTSDDFPS